MIRVRSVFVYWLLIVAYIILTVFAWGGLISSFLIDIFGWANSYAEGFVWVWTRLRVMEIWCAVWVLIVVAYKISQCHAWRQEVAE